MSTRETIRWYRYGAGKRYDRLLCKIAYKLPKRLTMWAFYRVLANATTGEWSNQVVPELTWQQAADRWPSQ